MSPRTMRFLFQSSPGPEAGGQSEPRPGCKGRLTRGSCWVGHLEARIAKNDRGGVITPVGGLNKRGSGLNHYPVSIFRIN